MVKLTAVHYGFDEDFLPSKMKQQKSTTACSESSPAQKNVPIPKVSSGKVKKSLKEKKLLKSKRREQMVGSSKKRTRPQAEFTCDNCGELFKTIQIFNMHRAQDFC